MHRLLALALLSIAVSACSYQGTLDDAYVPSHQSSADTKLNASVALVDDGLEKGKIVGGYGEFSFTLLVGPAIKDALHKELASYFETATVIDKPSETDKVDFYAFPVVEWITVPSSGPEFEYRMVLRVIIAERQGRRMVGDYRERSEIKYKPPNEARAAAAVNLLSLFALTPITEKVKTDAVGEKAQKIMHEAVDDLVHKFGKDMRRDQHLQFVASVGPLQDAPIVAGSTATASPYDKFLNSVVIVEVGRSFGSGFFVSQDGLIVTCRHVVGDAKTVTIKDRSGRKFTGTVLAISPERDLALIKVAGSDFPRLTLASDVTKSVGHDVVAIGTPEGLSWSISKGIVSAIRSLRTAHVVQTDATIAPGSSGGPLIDTKSGRVVGIASFGEGPGMNFAISADEVRKAFDRQLASIP